MSERYYVSCRERSMNGIACWWKPNRCGYTCNLDAAGLYTKAEADGIERISGGDDFGICERDVQTLAQERIVRTDWGDNWEAFKKRAPRAPEGENTP